MKEEDKIKSQDIKNVGTTGIGQDEKQSSTNRARQWGWRLGLKDRATASMLTQTWAASIINTL